MTERKGWAGWRGEDYTLAPVNLLASDKRDLPSLNAAALRVVEYKLGLIYYMKIPLHSIRYCAKEAEEEPLRVISVQSRLLVYLI